MESQRKPTPKPNHESNSVIRPCTTPKGTVQFSSESLSSEDELMEMENRTGASLTCTAVTPQRDITPAHYTIEGGGRGGSRGGGRGSLGEQSNGCNSNRA